MMKSELEKEIEEKDVTIKDLQEKIDRNFWIAVIALFLCIFIIV